MSNDVGMVLLRQPRKYEAVMGEFLKLPDNAEATELIAQVRIRVRSIALHHFYSLKCRIYFMFYSLHKCFRFVSRLYCCTQYGRLLPSSVCPSVCLSV